MIVVQAESPLSSAELEKLRYKINNAGYLHEAVQRIALILSNEFFEASRGGICHERKERK
jgi:hypothetical protein